DRRAVVVPVDALAVIPVIGDEMPCAEDQVILGHTDLELRGSHGRRIPDQTFPVGWSQEEKAEKPCSIGRTIVPSRSAAYKAAVTRSAVVPGLNRRPGCRSHSSSAWHCWRAFSRSGQPASRTSLAPRETACACSNPALRAINESGWR